MQSSQPMVSIDVGTLQKIAQIHEMLMQGGYNLNNKKAVEKGKRKTKDKAKKLGPGKEKFQMIITESDTTIYKPAVDLAGLNQVNEPEVRRDKLRNSSSSEELIDTSDEFREFQLDDAVEVPMVGQDKVNNNQVWDFIAEFNREREQGQGNARAVQYREEESRPGPSGYQPQGLTGAEQRAEQMIREAEASKVRMIDVQGKSDVGKFVPLKTMEAYFHSSMVDEQYSTIDAHVDDVTCRKIENSEYVDFARLLPRNGRSGPGIEMNDEDQLMEMINRNGRTFWVNAANRESGNISGFGRWEQAFRVFTNIYTSKYPSRAAELVQYNHMIHWASTTYAWDNVYHYDKEFRKHMSKFPQRSWAIILSQAYTMYLKDRNRFEGPRGVDRDRRGQASNSGKKDHCWKFNRG